MEKVVLPVSDNTQHSKEVTNVGPFDQLAWNGQDYKDNYVLFHQC